MRRQVFFFLICFSRDHLICIPYCSRAHALLKVRAQSACGLNQPSNKNERSLPRIPRSCFHFFFQESKNTKTDFCQTSLTWDYLSCLLAHALQCAVLQVDLQLVPVDKLLRFSFAPQYINFYQ